MKAHAHRWIVVAAIISVGAGAALSHMIEPGVRVEKVMLTTNTPALRIFPATPGPHPKALLAHGGGGSKEMLFRFAEAFAAAGFDCYSVDQAGHAQLERRPLTQALAARSINSKLLCKPQGHEVHRIGALDCRCSMRVRRSEPRRGERPELTRMQRAHVGGRPERSAFGGGPLVEACNGPSRVHSARAVAGI